MIFIRIVNFGCIILINNFDNDKYNKNLIYPTIIEQLYV